MAKIIFKSGQEVPISFFGISQMGILYIDCNLSITEAFLTFSNEENISEFKYVREVEVDNHKFENRETIITDFGIFVGIQNLYNGIDEGDPSIRITLMRRTETIHI